MFRRLASILAILLLSAPMAAAGVDASVRYLEGSAGCSSYEHGGHGGEWWYWYSASECGDRFDYAAAYAQAEGQTASAGLGAHEHEREYENGYGSGESTWRNGSHQSWSDERFASGSSQAWSRHAWADAAGATATLAHGCSSSRQAEESHARRSSSYWSENHSYSWGESSSEHAFSAADGCGTRIDAGRGNQSAVAAGVRDGCASRSTGGNNATYSSSGDSRNEWSDGWHAYESECGPRAFVSGPAAASAGTGSECASSSWDDTTYSSYNGSDEGRTTSWHENECLQGAFVDGPDGMRVFVGQRSWWESGCSGTWDAQECAEWEDHAWIVLLSWSHNPLGPHDQTVYLPVP